METMTEKKIKIAIKRIVFMPYTELCEFQGNLKSLSKENYEKLKAEILELDFSFAVHFWNDGKNNNITDGTQRLRAVKQMVEVEGYSCPPLPAVEQSAKNLKEAKRKVLAGASQFGKVERQGLYEYVIDSGLGIEGLRNSVLSGIDNELFKEEFFNKESEAAKKATIDPEIPFSTEIDEKNDYIVLLFRDKNQFKKACDKFGVVRVQYDLSPTKHEAFRHTGTGRVIDGDSIVDGL